MSENDIGQVQRVFLVLVALNDHFPLFYSHLPFFHPVLICLKYSGNLSQITQSPTQGLAARFLSENFCHLFFQLIGFIT